MKNSYNQNKQYKYPKTYNPLSNFSDSARQSPSPAQVQLRSFSPQSPAPGAGPASRSARPAHSGSASRSPSMSTPPIGATKSSSLPPASHILHPVESEIIKYILDQKYLSVEQLQKRFTKTKSIENLLIQLIKNEFLTTKDDKLQNHSLIRVTNKGYEHIKTLNPQLQIAKPINSIWAPRVNHDLTLNDLRIRFEELGFINKWFSEQMLQESQNMKKTFLDMPDAICRKTNNNCYILELEISRKAATKYEERIDLYKRVLEQEEIKAQKIEGVIFICADEKVVEVIKSKIAKDDKRFSVLHIHRYLNPKPLANKSNSKPPAQNLLRPAHRERANV